MEDQHWVTRLQALLAPDDIVRVTFESGRQIVIPALEYAEIVRLEERQAWVDVFTPEEWVDEGNLPL